MRILPIGSVSVLLGLALSCNSAGSAGGVVPVSELCVERLDNNYYPLNNVIQDDGDSIVCNFYSNGCLCSSQPLLVIEHAGSPEVTFNGKPLELLQNMHILNDDDACYDIGGNVIAGENIVSLHRSGTMGMPSAFISGNFDVVENAATEWLLITGKVPQLGDWASHGMPFYPGGVAYRRSFDVFGKVKRQTIGLGRWKGTGCEVWVNGSMVGEISQNKHKFRIGRFLSPGTNEVELRILGSTDNLYSGEYASCGLFEDFTIK